MDLFLLTLILLLVVTFVVAVTSSADTSNTIVVIRWLPLVALALLTLTLDNEMKSYKSIHKEIYEKGNLNETLDKVLKSKEYNEYKFERDLEENKLKGTNK